jgi:hypothetical protein
VLVPNQDALGREVATINLQTTPNSASRSGFAWNEGREDFECVAGCAGTEAKDPWPEVSGHV